MLRFALANLVSRPWRTLLATFGLTIAIAGMVGLFAIAGGIDALLASTLGPIQGILVLQAGVPVPLFSVLPAEWGQEIERIKGVGVVSPEVWTRVNILEGKPVLTPPRLLMGTDPPSRARLKHGVYDECLELGRFLDERDLQQPHVIISRQIAQDIGKTVGDVLEINGREMTIIGIYHCGSLILDVTIIADLSVVRELARMSPGAVSAFYVESAEGVPKSLVVERIQQAFAGRELPASQPSVWLSRLSLPPLTLPDLLKRLANSRDVKHASDASDSSSHPSRTPQGQQAEAAARPRHGNSPGNPLTVSPVAEWGERFSEMTADLDLVLALLTGVGVAIALSSIVNTMMMSVTERTVEFGILRANGWSQQDVVRLIVCESLLVGFAGGVLGVVCGWVATLVVNSVWADRVHLYAGPLLLLGSLLFSVAIGVSGGFYPALRAARLSPMAAIRRA